MCLPTGSKSRCRRVQPDQQPGCPGAGVLRGDEWLLRSQRVEVHPSAGPLTGLRTRLLQQAASLFIPFIVLSFMLHVRHIGSGPAVFMRIVAGCSHDRGVTHAFRFDLFLRPVLAPGVSHERGQWLTGRMITALGSRASPRWWQLFSGAHLFSSWLASFLLLGAVRCCVAFSFS